MSELAATLHTTWVLVQTSTWLKFSTPKIMESSGFYSLERKVLLWWLSILFLLPKKKTLTLLHTLLLKTSNNVFGGQILPLVAKRNPVWLMQRIFVGKMHQSKFLPYLDNKFKASTKLPKYSSLANFFFTFLSDLKLNLANSSCPWLIKKKKLEKKTCSKHWTICHQFLMQGFYFFYFCNFIM